MSSLETTSPGIVPSARTTEIANWRRESFAQLAAAQAHAADHGVTISNDNDLGYHLGTPKGEVSWYPATRLADLTDWPNELSNAMASRRPCPVDLQTCLQMVIDVLADQEQK